MGETARQVERLAHAVARARMVGHREPPNPQLDVICAQLDLLIELAASNAGFAVEARFRRPPQQPPITREAA